MKPIVFFFFSITFFFSKDREERKLACHVHNAFNQVHGHIFISTNKGYCIVFCGYCKRQALSHENASRLLPFAS